MKRNFIKAAVAFCVSALTFYTSAGFSKEGFVDTKDLPEQVRKVQDSVFLFLYDNDGQYYIGTAFVVAENPTHYFFATNNHIIKGRCEDNGLCPKVRLYQTGSFSLQRDSGFKFSSDAPFLTNIFVSQRSENPDYAVLVAEKKPNKPFSKERIPSPIPVTKSPLNLGDKVYTIGFPSVYTRTCPGHLPIKDAGFIYKRGSEGLYIGKFKSDDNANEKTQKWIGSTMDSLRGNSGGPILNVLGELVGMMQKSASMDDSGNCYGGNEIPGKWDWQSLGIPF